MIIPALVIPIGSDPPIVPAPSIVLLLVRVSVVADARMQLADVDVIVRIPEPSSVMGALRDRQPPVASSAITPVLLIVPCKFRKLRSATTNAPELVSTFVVPSKVPVVT